MKWPQKKSPDRLIYLADMELYAAKKICQMQRTPVTEHLADAVLR